MQIGKIPRTKNYLLFLSRLPAMAHERRDLAKLRQTAELYGMDRTVFCYAQDRVQLCSVGEKPNKIALFDEQAAILSYLPPKREPNYSDIICAAVIEQNKTLMAYRGVDHRFLIYALGNDNLTEKFVMGLLPKNDLLLFAEYSGDRSVADFLRGFDESRMLGMKNVSALQVAFGLSAGHIYWQERRQYDEIFFWASAFIAEQAGCLLRDQNGLRPHFDLLKPNYPIIMLALSDAKDLNDLLQWIDLFPAIQACWQDPLSMGKCFSEIVKMFRGKSYDPSVN